MKYFGFTLVEDVMHVNTLPKHCKIAFTLAEVLVTLGIIGVVAALTVPTLMQNHQRKVYSVQAQKVYTEISQAAIKKITDSNAVNLREARMIHDESYSKEGEFLKTYFKWVKDCGTTITPCFASEYDGLSAYNGAKIALQNKYAISLASGAAIALEIKNASNNHILIFDVDTNGAQGPNIKCRDLFSFGVNLDGSISNSYGGCLQVLMKHGWQMDESYDTEVDT